MITKTAQLSAIQKGGYWILCFGTLASLSALFILDVNAATKIFTLSSLVAVVMLLTQWKEVLSQKAFLLLPGVALLLGLSNLIWLDIFKPEHSEFSGTYRSYLYSGRIFISGAFIILAFHLAKICMRKTILYCSMALLAVCLIYAYLQQPTPRITLAFLLATTTGYATAILGVTVCGYLLNQQPKGFIFYFFAAFAVTLFTLFLTETRAAILSFPVIIFIMLFMQFIKNTKTLMKITTIFFIVVIAVLFAMKDIVMSRANNLMQDVNSYQNNNSRTSVGARLAMFEVGILTAKYSFIGQSIESRASAIHAASVKDKKLNGAMVFANVHLHNEIVEALSLKGISGVLLVIAFYLSLLWSAIRFRNITLFGITLSLLLFGLSDVLFYARDIPIITTLCIAFSLLLNKKVHDDSKIVS